MQDHPKAREDGLIVESIQDELIVFDERTGGAHCLTADAALVWRHCDGKVSLEDLAATLGLEEYVVARALVDLDEAHLLEAPSPELQGKYSRREAGLRIAKIGGAAMSLPLVLSVVVSPAAAFASVQTCFSTNPGGVPTGTQPAAGSKGYSTLAACGGGTTGQYNVTCYVQGNGAVICANPSCNTLGNGCGTCCATTGPGCTGGSCCSGTTFKCVQ